LIGLLVFTRYKYVVSPSHNGLILFDIDGTLTTGTENEKVVQSYIDKGYAVGIATAGGIYTPENLLSYDWMPRNLYDWMETNNFNTFNNVASHILVGKYDPKSYLKNLAKKPEKVFWPGWSKGLAMERTGKLYNTTNIILFDNDPSYIYGVSQYNKNLKVICAGSPCSSETLSMKSII
jgi:hypothetical protein